MSSAVEHMPKVWTEAGLEALPEEGYLHEVVYRELVEICHSKMQRHLLGPGGSLDGEHVRPGFQYPIADLFKEWEW